MGVWFKGLHGKPIAKAIGLRAIGNMGYYSYKDSY
jgi:hypothetical protein